MGVLVLLWTILVPIAQFGAANAQPIGGCTQIVQRLNNVAATINQNATAYWAHRAEFVDLNFGLSSATVANAMQVARGRIADDYAKYISEL
jgi:hypothetical protein